MGLKMKLPTRRTYIHISKHALGSFVKFIKSSSYRLFNPNFKWCGAAIYLLGYFLLNFVSKSKTCVLYSLWKVTSLAATTLHFKIQMLNFNVQRFYVKLERKFEKKLRSSKVLICVAS